MGSGLFTLDRVADDLVLVPITVAVVEDDAGMILGGAWMVRDKMRVVFPLVPTRTASVKEIMEFRAQKNVLWDIWYGYKENLDGIILVGKDHLIMWCWYMVTLVEESQHTMGVRLVVLMIKMVQK